MTPPRHFTIPIFIPELACPNRCVFCNQQKISGSLCQPTGQQVTETIEKYLSTIPSEGSIVEIGFFGGNFTGIGKQLQEYYLGLTKSYLQSGRVSGIRLSTRPDYIDEDVLALLKENRVTTIELGAQSLDEEVLRLSGRGHSVRDVRKAAKLINEAGFELGMQMMVGLPGDTPEKSLETAREIVGSGAVNTRIYPTLVIKDTELEKQYKRGEYFPLSLNDAIQRVKELIPVFAAGDVKILRIGLHPSDGLLNGTNLVAGPFHPAFGEMVRSEMWKDRFKVWLEEAAPFSSTTKKPGDTLLIEVAPGQQNAAIGHRAANKQLLLSRFAKIKLVNNPEFSDFQFRITIQ